MLLLDIKFEVHCTGPGGCHSKLWVSSVQTPESNEYALYSLEKTDDNSLLENVKIIRMSHDTVIEYTG